MKIEVNRDASGSLKAADLEDNTFYWDREGDLHLIRGPNSICFVLYSDDIVEIMRILKHEKLERYEPFRRAQGVTVTLSQ